MFNSQELLLISEACLTEKKFLESVVARGIPVDGHIANITLIRTKALEGARSLQKAEATKAKEAKEAAESRKVE